MKKDELDRLRLKLSGFNVSPVPAVSGDAVTISAVSGPAAPATDVYLYYTLSASACATGGDRGSSSSSGSGDGARANPSGARGEPLNAETKVGG